MTNAASPIERFLKSFAFSALLAAGALSIAGFRIAGLVHIVKSTGKVDYVECLWVGYALTVAFLFLTRTRPRIVSLDPVHWLFALVTSFSGLMFRSDAIARLPFMASAANVLICVGVVISAATLFTLGRSYDLFPALRRVKTGLLYEIVRHPMYLASLLTRGAYVMKHPGWFNISLLVVVAWLYHKRAEFEEGVLLNDPGYRDYARRVRFKFLPGIY